jgi:hypothetical protein
MVENTLVKSFIVQLLGDPKGLTDFKRLKFFLQHFSFKIDLQVRFSIAFCDSAEALKMP